jgi:hypothetical protein
MGLKSLLLLSSLMNLCMLHSPHANPTVREVREERGRGERREKEGEIWTLMLIF